MRFVIDAHPQILLPIFPALPWAQRNFFNISVNDRICIYDYCKNYKLLPWEFLQVLFLRGHCCVLLGVTRLNSKHSMGRGSEALRSKWARFFQFSYMLEMGARGLLISVHWSEHVFLFFFSVFFFLHRSLWYDMLRERRDTCQFLVPSDVTCLMF